MKNGKRSQRKAGGNHTQKKPAASDGATTTTVPNKRQRKERVCIDVFGMEKMHQDLIAALDCRKLGFSMAGTSYPKANRNGNADAYNLRQHAVVLRVLFKHCPSGWPAQCQTRDLMIRVHDDLPDLFAWPPEWCDLSDFRKLGYAADRWRIMTKHVVNSAAKVLKKQDVGSR